MGITTLSGISEAAGVSSPNGGISNQGGISDVAASSNISCAYPLNAPSSEWTGLGYLALAMSNSDTTGTYTVLGAPASQKVAGAGPVGFSNGTAATMSFTSGSKVIAWGITIPAAVNTGSGAEAYRASPGIYTTALAGVFVFAVRAIKDGTWAVQIFRGAGLTQVYTVTGLTSCPTTVALAMNCDAGTCTAYIGGVAVTLSDNTFTPSAMIAVETVVEFTTSDAGDAGKTVSATQYTQAADIPGAYQPGVTDPCGNLMPANYLVDNLGNNLVDNNGNYLVWV